MITKLTTVLILVFATLSSIAAKQEPDKSYKVVVMNLNSPAVDSFFPFDEPFLLQTEVPLDATSFTCVITGVRRNGNTITPQTHVAIPIKIDSPAKFVAQFIVHALPPNSEITLSITVRRNVSELPSYMKTVRTAIEQFVKTSARTPTPITTATLNPLQTQLINTFNAQYAGYVANFTGTILDASNWTAAATPLAGLYNSYSSAMTAISNINPFAISPPSITSFSDLRVAYRFAVELKAPEADLMLQILGSNASDWELIRRGMLDLDPAKTSSLVYAGLVMPNADMTAAQLTEYLNRIDHARATIAAVSGFVNGRIYQNPDAIKFINGGTATTAQAAAIDARFNQLVTDLNDEEGLLLAVRTQLVDAIREVNNFETRFAAIIGTFKFTLENNQILTASSAQTFETRGSWYIGADAGLVFIPKISEVQPYYGANIYFSPVNKNTSYNGRQLRAIYNVRGAEVFGMWLAKHACLNIGVIPNSIASTEKRIENLWGNNTVMLGAGLRLGSAFRITGGGVIFRGYKGDLLSTKKQLKTTPYISASVDINLLKFFGKVGSVIGLVAP